MIIGLIALCILAGLIAGFRTGLGQWKLAGMVGVLIELIFGVELLHIYPHADSELPQAFVAAFGGLVVGNAIGTPIGAFFNFPTQP